MTQRAAECERFCRDSKRNGLLVAQYASAPHMRPWVRWLLVFAAAWLLAFVIFFASWSGGSGAVD